jgi:hypothetical protein
MHRLSQLLGFILLGGVARSRNRAARKNGEGAELSKFSATVIQRQRGSVHFHGSVLNGPT